MAYLEAFELTKNQEYADIAHEIFNYVLRDMTDKKGRFYSADDADSENEEGKFIHKHRLLKQITLNIIYIIYT